MVKRKVKRQAVKRYLVLLPCTITLLTVLVLTIGKYWVEIVNKYQEQSNLNEELIALKEKEAELSVDVEKLSDPDYVARYAREKYLFSKDGEVILKIPEE